MLLLLEQFLVFCLIAYIIYYIFKNFIIPAISEETTVYNIEKEDDNNNNNNNDNNIIINNGSQ